MIPLDSPQWLKMQSWCGEPVHTPAWLRHWLATRDGEALSELLWRRLSAQQSYSEAAIAALPYLTRELDTLPEDQQAEICSFVAMTMQQPVDEEHREAIAAAERAATRLLETQPSSSCPDSSLLAAVAAFQRWESGAAFFERFDSAGTELWAACPDCGADLELQLEERQGWCKPAERKSSHKPVYVVEPARDTSHAASQRVVELLGRRVQLDVAGTASLAAQFMLFMGTTKCPACDAELSVPEVVSG